MTDKILIALQFWAGDRDQADGLTRYLVDLEPEHSNYADFLVVNRHDCTVPVGMVENLSRRFNVWKYQAPRGMTGWPAGCNSLWTNTTQWVKSMIEAKRIPHYKAIFVCESDGSPVFRDWVRRMSLAWDQANRPNPVCVAGPVVQIPAEHMNGNLLMSGATEQLRWLARMAQGVPATAGWDWILSSEFKKRGWASIPGMLSLYNTRGYTEGQFRKMQEDQVIWVHGVKDTSLWGHGRRLLLKQDYEQAL